jgi:hypothetical protein
MQTPFVLRNSLSLFFLQHCLPYRRHFLKSNKVLPMVIGVDLRSRVIGRSIALAPELQFDFRGSDRITALNGSHSPRSAAQRI